MARITAPVEGFNGLVGNVEFKDSVAVTDDAKIIGYCRRSGYLVEDEPPDDGPLKGAALDKALDGADLPKSGTVAEKRARLSGLL